MNTFWLQLTAFVLNQGMEQKGLICILCLNDRVNQIFLLRHDSCWSREHCGNSTCKYTPWTQWGYSVLPYQVHNVCLLLYSAMFNNLKKSIEQLNFYALSLHSFIYFWWKRKCVKVSDLLKFVYTLPAFLSFRSDVSSNFEIDIEVYGLVSVLHLMACVFWFLCLLIVHLGGKSSGPPFCGRGKATSAFI